MSEVTEVRNMMTVYVYLHTNMHTQVTHDFVNHEILNCIVVCCQRSGINMQAPGYYSYSAAYRQSISREVISSSE